jgi:hypothetical protein
VSKKPQKTKTPKVNGGDKGSSTKDSITGLTVTVDGYGTITSDKVYDKNSSLIRNSLGIPSDYLNQLQSFDAELEFNSSYIAFTTRQVDMQGKVGATRTVFQGRFAYEKNRVKSARIDYMAQISDSGDYGYGGINYLGITIKHPSSGYSWMSAINSALNNPNSSTASFDIGAETPGEITGSYPAVASFGNGRFFYDGWKENPFASNLL